MLRRRHRIAAALFVCADLIATLLAFLAAWFLRFQSALFETAHFSSHQPDFDRYLRLLPILLLLFATVALAASSVQQ